LMVPGYDNSREATVPRLLYLQDLMVP